ncbi:MAG: hypothetical protein AAFY33_22000, partial [Cyanobacteria bacterium J06643_4]
RLLPCVSLHELLNLVVSQPAATGSQLRSAAMKASHSKTNSFGLSATLASSASSTQQSLEIGAQGGYSRLVVIKQLREVWAFEVNEFYGLHTCQQSDLRRAPALSNQSLSSFTQSIFAWHGQNVSYLDAEKLLAVLRQRAL